MTPTLLRLLACAAAVGGIAAGTIVFDVSLHQLSSVGAGTKQSSAAERGPHVELVPHWIIRDVQLRPGARRVEIGVYDHNLTKSECLALVDAYASGVGTGGVAVWGNGSGPTTDRQCGGPEGLQDPLAPYDPACASALCIGHFNINPPDYYFLGMMELRLGSCARRTKGNATLHECEEEAKRNVALDTRNVE
jgi:hypothetical protein